MVSAIHTVIIGAGITGITCAQRLHEAGVSLRVIDKGRGIGGRIATRRIMVGEHELRFDHGAQYFCPRDLAFREALVTAGAVDWNEDSEHGKLVGPSGISGVPRMLAKGLPISQQIEITSLKRERDHWFLESVDECFSAERLVLSIPAPQALRLLGETDPVVDGLQRVEMSPCLTLMAAFPEDSTRPFTSKLDPAHSLSWIAQDSSKASQNTGFVAWVAQAGREFSVAHIENTPEDIASLMLPLLCAVIGARPEEALYAQVHRWRYAQASRPLGRPFLKDMARNLYIGGDWCLGARAEDGWLSGQAIADSIIKADYAN